MADPSVPEPEHPHPKGAADPEQGLGRYAPDGAPPTDDPLDAASIRAAVRRRTSHGYGAELAEHLTPLGQREAVAESLALAAATARETDAGRPLPRPDLPEIRPVLDRARIEHAVLTTEELAAVHGFLAAAAAVEETAGSAEEPLLVELLDKLQRPEDLFRHLDRILDPAGGIRDEASDELLAARSEVRRTRERVRTRLEERAGSRELRPHLQDTRITLRQGRYVLAVKAASQGQLKGVIHAASGSGETVFMEPLETVALNNAVEAAEAEAQRAEHRVRLQATKAVARAREDLEAGIALLAQVDLLAAGEALRRDLAGSVPDLGEGPGFQLEGAAHPLLVLEHGPGEVVTNDLALGGETPCLVVSGPNTGGKTVLLKAVGLAHWMAYCGLPIAGAGRVGWFRDLWAVIGDQQSLAADLSTFSAQVVRLKGLLADLDSERLVLIDELGTGTNPNEGSALGVAVLERLRAADAVALVTTHLDRLKHYAVAHDGVVNAALSFDVARLEPTFRLEWAQAGRSQALEIAARLGVPEDLLDAAREALGEDNLEVEQLLNERDRLLAEAESERTAAAEARQRAQDAESEADELRAQVAAERERAYRESAERWQEVLEGAREEVRTVIRRLKETGNTAEADRALADLDAEFRAVEPAERVQDGDVKGDREVRVGDWGRLAPFRKAGVVVAVDPDRGELQMDLDGKRVSGNLQDFQRTQPAGSEPEASGPGPAPRQPRATAETRIDLRGQRRDEALAALESFLDNAYGSGLGRVTILHGKGSGILAQAVQETLGDDPRVAEFGFARPESGGAGVTEVVFEGADAAGS